MWFYVYCCTLLVAGVYAHTIRQLILAAVHRVKTREPRTIAELRFIVHMLHGKPEDVVLVTTKDRSAPTGRRGAVRLAKAKISEEQRRKDALGVIRKRLGHKLKQRREDRQKGMTLWDYFSWKHNE